MSPNNSASSSCTAPVQSSGPTTGMKGDFKQAAIEFCFCILIVTLHLLVPIMLLDIVNSGLVSIIPYDNESWFDWIPACTGMVGLNKMAIFERKFIEVKGINTAYVDQGSGPEMVLLHGGGGGCSADDFYLNIDPLSEHFHVYGLESVGIWNDRQASGRLYDAGAGATCTGFYGRRRYRISPPGRTFPGRLGGYRYRPRPSREGPEQCAR